MTEPVGPGDGLGEEGAEVALAATELRPKVAVITGSGLGGALSEIEADVELDYPDLPGFPAATVPGHAGKLVIGTFEDTPVAAFLGRVHFYEGHPMSLVTLPARIAAAMGVETLVITASTGGLNPSFWPGTLVVGTDHINMLGENPLRGWHDPEGRPVFVDLSDVYPQDLRQLALDAADDVGVAAGQGVYASAPGPTYETPAEIGFIRSAGADVVGMSVVPEACAAVALGMRCLGLYCVTNEVGGYVSHEDVMRVAGEFAGQLREVLRRVIPALGKE